MGAERFRSHGNRSSPYRRAEANLALRVAGHRVTHGFRRLFKRYLPHRNEALLVDIDVANAHGPPKFDERREQEPPPRHREQWTKNTQQRRCSVTWTIWPGLREAPPQRPLFAICLP